MRVPFQINSRGKELLGVLHIADEQYKIPIVVVMCYGLNGSRVEQHRMSVKFGELCEQNSINLVRFDYVNVGISEGDFFFSNLSERVDNVLDICNFISGCFDREILVFLVGFSDGAKIAIQAKEYINNISGMIFWNPMINIPRNAHELSTNFIISEKFRMHKKYKKPYKQLFGVSLNTTIIKEIDNDRSINTLNDNIAKLFVFGGNDNFTENIRNFVAAEIKQNARIAIINNSGHLFGKTIWEKQVNEITVQWIQEYINEYK